MPPTMYDIREFMGHPIGEIIALVKAWDEGRIIVPPCKVGDVVWYITGIHRTLVKPAIVEEIIIDSNGVKDLFVKSENGSFENSIDIFYRSKEEAEQALKGDKDINVLCKTEKGGEQVEKL